MRPSGYTEVKHRKNQDCLIWEFNPEPLFKNLPINVNKAKHYGVQQGSVLDLIFDPTGILKKCANTN